MTDLLDSTTATLPTVRRATETSRPPTRLQNLRAQPWGDAVLVGAVGLVVAVAFSWVPSVWYDESATIVSAQRTWTELWSEIHTVDAVHATYYALMHGWFALVGYSPFSLRFPSAVAIAVAAALLTVLAKELTTKRTGIVAGLLFVLLPRVTWMGGEGRSYATATALATAATLVFVLAVKRTGTTRRAHTLWWTLYGVLALASTAVFLYSALLIVGHGVTLALWIRRGRLQGRSTPWRPAAAGWIVSAGIAGALLIPLARLASTESKQISWISKPNWQTFIDVYTWQWFMNDWWFAAFAWILAILGVVAVVRSRSRSASFGVLQVALPWMLVPTLGLIAVSLVHSPLYSPRYVAFAAPAMALMMAVGLTSLRPRRRVRARTLVAAGLVVAVGMTLPSYVSQRLPEAKDSSSWSQVAALVAKERALEGVNATDAIVYGHIRRHPTGSARNIAYAYPAAFSGMTDVTLKTPAAQTDGLWETRYPLSQTIERADGHTYVWLVTSIKQDLRPSVTKALSGEGYHLQDEWHLTWVNVLRYRL
ncbi:mannosyltransferase [Frondihabitans sucicola]|uniref:Mannosyltransferase n=1 Tax=Frondihabitans sucicola TaxID=1268041 RepID=A0ABM8GMB3_9MICO|nr:glycosyltransferase family 39 protein [Frondihabitans sucicola]BDZ49557.1 mannosyltransferase [Frondihabitans sucicola]